MTYAITVLPKLDEKFKKIARKERGQYERIREKVREMAHVPPASGLLPLLGQ